MLRWCWWYRSRTTYVVGYHQEWRSISIPLILLRQARPSARTEFKGVSLRSGFVQVKSEGVDLILTQGKIWNQYSHSLVTGIQGFLPWGKKATKLAIKMLCMRKGLVVSDQGAWSGATKKAPVGKNEDHKALEPRLSLRFNLNSTVNKLFLSRGLFIVYYQT